jgi:hypothetical protein
MCLIVEGHSPFNSNRIRWKILDKQDKEYFSCFRSNFFWKNNKASVEEKDIPAFGRGFEFGYGGIHVFVNREDARKTLKLLKNRDFHANHLYQNCVIRKVKVSGCICRGYTSRVGTGMDDLKSEAWQKAEIIE